MTAHRNVWITPVNPAAPTVSWALFGTATLTGGVGGWEVLDRPRQLDALEWVKQPSHQLVLTLVVSSVDSGAFPIDALIGRLHGYGKPAAPGAAPPLLRLSGPIDQPAPWTLWAMDDITPSDVVDTIRGDDGLLRQTARTLTLREWTGATILLGPAAAARARAGK